jgi:hypothetical protein
MVVGAAWPASPPYPAPRKRGEPAPPRPAVAQQDSYSANLKPFHEPQRRRSHPMET